MGELMDRLWAPWRKGYIRPELRKKRKGCLFCGLLQEDRDPSNFILTRSSLSFAILNLYPYNNGHVLILPQRHVAQVSDLTNEERLDWLELFVSLQNALEVRMHPHGFNAGINLGSAAGAGIPEHLHLHIVPRWQGDMNFMPVLAGAKVISESLKSVYKEISHALKDQGKMKRRPAKRRKSKG